MTDSATTTRAPYSVRAILALGVSVAALVLPAPLSAVAAIAAIVIALRARVELRNDPELRGTWASLLGFLVGCGVLIVNALGVLPGLFLLLP